MKRTFTQHKGNKDARMGAQNQIKTHTTIRNLTELEKAMLEDKTLDQKRKDEREAHEEKMRQIAVDG